MYPSRLILLLSCLLYSSLSAAVLTIEITEGAEGALPTAIVPFAWDGPEEQPPVDIAAVITADLRRSGRFSPFPVEDMLGKPHTAREIRFPEWRLLGPESLVIGRVKAIASGYEVQFQLFDVFRQTQLTGFSFRTQRENLRWTAHRISDLVYETLLGSPGAFATRIAYVTETISADGQSRRYELNVADADGQNPQLILRSSEPLLSPAWSPDAKKLAYVSFETHRSAIYLQDVATGAREQLVSFAGLNGAPAWSPDGRRMALVRSRDGNPEIYLFDLGSRRLQRITHSYAIDTEPAWAPDGRSLVFTSDRGGRPQIYRYTLRDRRTERLTFEGNYNSRAAFSPDGKLLTMVHAEKGRYQIAILDLANGALQLVSDGPLDESPSFAPNGSMVIYASSHRGRGVLAAVSVDGRVKQRLAQEGGDAREPVWSPYLQ